MNLALQHRKEMRTPPGGFYEAKMLEHYFPGQVCRRLTNTFAYKITLNLIESGTHLLSRAVTHQVSSAVQVLTVVFGMGTGVSPERIATENILMTRTRIELVSQP